MPANVCRIFGSSYEILINSNKRISFREYCSKSRVPISLQRIYATDLIRPDKPAEIAEVLNPDNTAANTVEVDKRQAEIKDWRKGSKKSSNS